MRNIYGWKEKDEMWVSEFGTATENQNLTNFTAEMFFLMEYVHFFIHWKLSNNIYMYIIAMQCLSQKGFKEIDSSGKSRDNLT